jgi:hypothetical protein
MEPHPEERTAPPPSAEQKPKRFRIVKLEDRIAPNRGGIGTNNGCYSGHGTVCPTAYGPACPGNTSGCPTETCPTYGCW